MLTMNMPITEKIHEKDLQGVCRDDIRESEKHDIILSISQLISDCPSSIAKAEQIFDSVKYCVAQHIVKYELESVYYSNPDMQYMLEEKSSPESTDRLHSVIDQFLL
jgi:hypothetical protein